MDYYREKILEAGINLEEIKNFENKIEITLDYILEDYDYEPQNKKGLINAIQDTMFKTVVFDSTELNRDIKTTFTRFHSDFDDPKSSNAVGALQVILGYSSSINFEEYDVNRDITILASKIMERNYNQGN